MRPMQGKRRAKSRIADEVSPLGEDYSIRVSLGHGGESRAGVIQAANF
jgi:hypothetical protein